MSVDVAVLLSTGRHPVSGRSRMSPADAAALELALRITPAPLAIHVGAADDTALRDYLGMGLANLTVLEGPAASDDILAVLLDQLRRTDPRLIIAGEQAETGESSGMLPYLLARELGRPLLPQVVGLAFEGARIVAVRQLPGGRKHRIAADMPAIVTVPAQGVKPRHPAFGPSRRGRIEIVTAGAPPDHDRLNWPKSPARARPPRLRPSAAKSAGTSSGPLSGLSPREAAEEILRFLSVHGLAHK